MFQPHPWIQRWACSRSWAVAPVLQYFRALRGDFAHINKKTTTTTWPSSRVWWPLLLEFLLGVKNTVPINRPLPAGTRYTPPRHGQALSTSFEKTCMRQIHSPLIVSILEWLIKVLIMPRASLIIKQTLKSSLWCFLCWKVPFSVDIWPPHTISDFLPFFCGKFN